MTNQEIINHFFDYYGRRDMNGLKTVVSENIKWTFAGQHPFAGVKHGIDEVVAFFDIMSGIMGKSMPQVEKLVTGENNNYIIECQHIKTNREDGINIDHYVSVLWTFENGKIVAGMHLFADPKASDSFFTAMAAN